MLPHSKRLEDFFPHPRRVFPNRDERDSIGRGISVSDTPMPDLAGAVWPDWANANTLQAPACSGELLVGWFLRGTRVVTLPTLFEAFGTVTTAAEIYKAWREAPIVAFPRPFRRGARLSKLGSAKGVKAKVFSIYGEVADTPGAVAHTSKLCRECVLDVEASGAPGPHRW